MTADDAAPADQAVDAQAVDDQAVDDQAALADLAQLLGLPLLSAEEQMAVLDLTRVVAHGVQRRFGPLTAYALGLAMSTRSDPADRALRVRRTIELLSDPPVDAPPVGGGGGPAS